MPTPGRVEFGIGPGLDDSPPECYGCQVRVG